MWIKKGVDAEWELITEDEYRKWVRNRPFGEVHYIDDSDIPFEELDELAKGTPHEP